MQYYKQDVYQRSTTKLPVAYMANMLEYLSRQFPDLPREQLVSFVKAESQKTIKKPKLTIIDQPSYGNNEIIDVDLLKYTDKLRSNIITPCGALYMPPSQKASFLKTKLQRNKKARKLHKNLMFDAINISDSITEALENNIQASIKIETNSIPGAMGSPYNPLYDLPGYNAITSVSRHCIMCGYAHVERLVEGNFYFPTMDHCINHWVQLLRKIPSNVEAVVAKYKLFVPTPEDVFVYFAESLKLYGQITEYLKTTLMSFLQRLTSAELTYLFYAGSLKPLLTRNEDLFRRFLSVLYRKDIEVDTSVDPNSIFKLNGDLLAVVSSLNADVIERKAVAVAVKECPEGIKQLIAIGKHMQATFDKLGDLIACFLRVDCDIPDAMQHKNMIRKAVIISDTDSVIFSTQSWVEWYTGKAVSFERSAYEMNAFVVLNIVLTLEHLFARLSSSIGVEDKDIYQIAMKNEFLYPLMLRTPLPKQYAGQAEIQEGFVLPKLKDDIKGLSFRSSTMCRETVKAGNDFLKWIFETVTKQGSIKASDCIARALAHERRVIESLESGDKTFLTSTPIREGEDYKDEAISVYYYWKLWDEVFKPKFGEFVIPGKGYVLPLIGDGSVLKTEHYQQRLREFDKALYERLTRFMEANARKITRLVIPMTIRKVPEILRPLVDIRSIVYSNSTPFIVTLRSLGLGYTSSKDMTLLSDTYG